MFTKHHKCTEATFKSSKWFKSYKLIFICCLDLIYSLFLICKSLTLIQQFLFKEAFNLCSSRFSSEGCELLETFEVAHMSRVKYIKDYPKHKVLLHSFAILLSFWVYMRFFGCCSFSCYGYQALKQNKNVGVNRNTRKYICILTALSRPQHISKYHVECHVFSSNYIFDTCMQVPLWARKW